MDFSANHAPPTEDTVEALMAFLVDPYLPKRASTGVPQSNLREQNVAKQMHAVVLLYNYYHRQQFPQLEFLDFESFCKVAVNARPNLLMYLTFMQRCNEESMDLDKQLSSTEKMIKQSCNICQGLGVLKDVPSIETWPVSKVAVFLVDSMEQNCLLLFSSVTEGVWSPIEKDLDQACHHLESVPGLKNKTKDPKCLSRDEYCLGKVPNLSIADEALFQKIAYSTVKGKTGIDQTDLVVLERHFVYSLSQDKTTTRFYLMQCIKGINGEITQVPIKDVINSLRGPLVRKSLDGYETAPVVEYFHLLPYSCILSDWLSRETSSSLQLQLEGSGNQNKMCSPNSLKCSSNSDSLPRNSQIADILNNNMISTNEIINKQWNDPYCTGGSPRAAFRSEDMADSSLLESQLQISTSEDATNTLQNVIQEKHLERRTGFILQSKPDASESRTKDKVEMAASMIKPCDAESLEGEHLTSSDTCDPCLTNQDGLLRDDLPLLRCHSNSHDKVHVAMVSKRDDLFQAALRALLKKRDELTHKQRFLDDEMARCERNLQTILSGGEDDWMLKLESIIEACNMACLKGVNENCTLDSREQISPLSIKRKRLCEAVLNLQNPCQELDEICCQNNWILPRYSVFPSNEGFQANVTVKGVDFECSGGGDLRSDPREARESAAAHMLSKLRSMASQAQ